MEVQISPATYNGGYPIKCNGNSDGKINSIIIGGTAPFIYNWSNGANTQNINTLSSGTYTLTVTQSGGSTATASITLHEPQVLDPSLYSPVFDGGTNISESGGSDGKIILTDQGGTPPYEYSWSNGSPEQNQYYLTAGTYTVTVTDVNSCKVTRSISLTEPTPLTIASISSPAYNGYNIHCKNGSDGSINLSISGGMPPYEILWNNGSFEEDPAGLAAGDYSVRVIDLNGTQVEAAITLTEPTALSLELIPLVYPNGYHISLFGGYDGSITTNASGGIAPITFLWDDATTTQNRTTLNHGNKSVTVTDANGCNVSAEVGLFEPGSKDWMMSGNTGTNPNTQFIGTADSTDFVFRTNNQEHLRLDAFGKLKINSLQSNTPGLDLLFVDELGVVQKMAPSCNVVKNIPWTFGGNLITGIQGFTPVIGTCNDHDFAFITDNIERARINISGNMGIGTTTPQSKLDVDGGVVIGNTFAGNTPAPSNGLLVEGQVVIGQPDIANTKNLEVRNNGQVEIACVSSSINNSRIWVKNQSGAYSFGVSSNGFGHLYSGDFSNVSSVISFNSDGKVGIGMQPPLNFPNNLNYKFYVEGSIVAREIKVTTLAFPDFVFNSGYRLPTISELTTFIQINKHLPGIPSAKEVESNQGFELGDMQMKLLKKVEEQTLYIIDLQNQVDELRKELETSITNKRRR